MKYSEMELQLIKLLYDYSIKGKLVDKSYIEKFIDIVVNYQGLNDYVKEMDILQTIDDETLVSMAGYNPMQRKIYVFIDGINEFLLQNEKYRVLFNSIEQVFYQNVLVSQVILHELEHANQKRMILSGEKSLEAKILRTSNTDYIVEKILERLKSLKIDLKTMEMAIQTLSISFNKLYHIYYQLVPEERLAEIKSHGTMIKVLETMKKQIPNLREFEFINQLENMVRGYSFAEKDISSPTIDFVTLLGVKSELKQFDWYDKDISKTLFLTQGQFSLTERMVYGLPINSQEYYSVDRIIKMSNKHNI